MNLRSVAVALGFIVSTAVAGAAYANQVIVGAASKVQLQVQASLSNQIRELRPAEAIWFGDALTTGSGARLEAKLGDGTVLTLGEKARITVDEFVYDPKVVGGKLDVTVHTGAFLFVGGKIEGPTGGNVTINTPVGTLGVRGTTVWGGYIDGGYGVLVLDGEVSVTTLEGQVLLQKGQGTMVYHNRPSQPGTWPKDRVTRAVATISFGTKKAQGSAKRKSASAAQSATCFVDGVPGLSSIFCAN